MLKKVEKSKFALHPFHILMAWVLLELFYPVILVGVRHWYHNVLMVLWMLVLFVIDMVLKKMKYSLWRIWMLELAFVAMVVVFGILIIK